MRNQNTIHTPVGVVPRRQAEFIAPLITDSVEGGVATEALLREQRPASPVWGLWLPSLVAVAAIANALDWLKLPR